MLFKALAVALGLIATEAAIAPQAPRVLRKHRARPEDVNRLSQNAPPGVCMDGVPYVWYMLGEKTKADGMFLVHNPDLSQHRQMLGYTDQDVMKFWDAAIEYAWEYGAIDFRSAEYDVQRGLMEIDGFIMMPVTMDFGLRMVMTTTWGHLDCPTSFGDEAIVVIATKDGTYHGSFGTRIGGEAGAPAYAGEISVAWGSYAIDLDMDGVYEELPYYSNSPMRNILGATRIDCNVIHPTLGPGRNTGKLEVKNIGTGGLPHGSVRSWGSWPYGFNFDKQYCYQNNNFCQQWAGF